MLKRYLHEKIVSRAFMCIPPRLLDAMSPIGLIIPYYHIVSDEKVVHVCNLYPYKGTREFTEDLDFLMNHFHPIGLEDVLKAVEGNGELRRRCLHLTFDDGFRELHDVVAPILLRKGIPATFFINSAFTDNKTLCYHHKGSILAEHAGNGLSEGIFRSVKDLMDPKGVSCADISSAILSVPYGRMVELDELAIRMEVDFNDYAARTKPYMDSSQIRSLIGKGFTIGSHSIDHPLYADIGFDEQIRQTVESTRWVREEFGLGYGAFAFPHNDRHVGERFHREIRASGQVDVSFGTEGMINRKLSRHLQRFSLENPMLPAERIVAMEYARYMWRGSRSSTRPPVSISPA